MTTLEILDTSLKLSQRIGTSYCGISQNHFAIVSDWLYAVNRTFKNKTVTHSLAVKLLNQYYKIGRFEESTLQLVACCCHYVAACLIEEYPSESDDYIYVTDNAYTLQEFETTTLDVLKVLQGRTYLPNYSYILDLIYMIDTEFKDMQRRSTEQLLSVASLIPDLYNHKIDDVVVAAIFLVRRADDPSYNGGLIIIGKSYRALASLRGAERYTYSKSESLVQKLYRLVKGLLLRPKLTNAKLYALAKEKIEKFAPSAAPSALSTGTATQSLTKTLFTEEAIGTKRKELGAGVYGTVFRTKVGKSTVAIKQQEKEPLGPTKL